MTTRAPFNLETALATWRRFVLSDRSISEDDADELEGHLRDEIEALVAQGHAAEDAFRKAVPGMGDYATIETAYRRVYWKKLRAERRALDEIGWRLSILGNYLKVALRTLRRQQGSTVIHVTGLAVGLACCLLMLLYVRDELSYDRFHENADRMYRLSAQLTFGDRTFQTLDLPGGLASDLVRDVPAALEAVRANTSPPKVRVQTEVHTYFEDGLLWSESSLFSVFSFPLLQGDPLTVLDRPHTVALSASTARRYFGGTDPVGRFLYLGTDATAFEITGVFKDVPHNSHLQFDLVASIVTEATAAERWEEERYVTYVLLEEDASRADVVQTLSRLGRRHSEAEVTYRLQPLTGIYLSDDPLSAEPPGHLRGNSTYLYLFSAIAVVVLLIACINYTNLATARSLRRAREVGIRKVVGAHQGQLIAQFLGESMLVCLGAGLLSLGLVALSLPTFNALTGKTLAVSSLGSGSLLPVLPAITVLVGLLAGSYPAFVLAAFRPMWVLKDARQGGGFSALRKGLVVFQFITSLLLIIATAIVQQQLAYTRGKPLGFDKEQVVLLKPAGALQQDQAAFATTIEELPGVVQAAYGQIPGVSWASLAYPEERAEDEKGIRTYITAVDYDFLPTLDVRLVAGRNLSPEHGADAQQAVLLNETAARAFGWEPQQAVDKTFRLANTPYEVVGVVQDYHFQSMKQRIEPLMMHLEGNNLYRTLAVRIRPENRASTLAALQTIWEQFIPDRPFTYAFLDEEVDAFYRAEATWERVLRYASALTMLIACLGLLGLVALMAAERTKEIGIRKVLGASVPGLVVLLSKEFVLLVGLAFAIAAPLAYLAMNRWLGDFAYRIAISWPVFLMAGLTALGVALLTVSYQSIKAALADPVETLRYE